MRRYDSQIDIDLSIAVADNLFVQRTLAVPMSTALFSSHCSDHVSKSEVIPWYT